MHLKAKVDPSLFGALLGALLGIGAVGFWLFPRPGLEPNEEEGGSSAARAKSSPSLAEARAAFAARRFEAARAGLAAFLAAHPDDPQAPARRFELAVALIEGGSPDHAAALAELEHLARAGKLDSGLGRYYRGLARRGRGRELSVPPDAERLRERLLVPRSARWRYFKGRQPPPRSWREVDFDDGAWLEGETSIGYGDDDDRTVLEDMRGQYGSVFLRRSFTVPAALLSGARQLIIRAYYDDGFAAHLNGVEVARGNLPGPRGAPVPYNALAESSHEAEEYEEMEIPLRSLRAGRNTLALQVHQATLSSSDLSIDAELAVIESLPPGDPEAAAELFRGAAADLEAALAAFGPGGPEARLDRERQARLDLADALLLLGRAGEAATVLTPLLDEAPGRWRRPALYLTALARWKEGKLLEAGGLLSRLAPFGSGAGELHAAYLLGRIHHRLGERPEALALYERVIQGHEESRRRPEEAGAPPLHAIQALLLRSTALFELGRTAEAQAGLERFRAQRHPSLLRRHAVLFESQLLLQQGRADEAAALLLSLVASGLEGSLERRAFLWAGRAVLLQAERQGAARGGPLARRGVELLERAAAGAALDAAGLMARRELAEAHSRSGRHDAAARLLSELAEAGALAAAHLAHRRAVGLELQGKQEAAVALAFETLAAHPGSPQEAALHFRAAEGLFLSALAASDSLDERSEELEAAGRHYEQALASAARLPHADRARFHLGLCRLLLGREEDAEAAFAEIPASRLKGGIAPAAYFRARLRFSRLAERCDEALSAARALRDADDALKLLDDFLKEPEQSPELTPRAVLALIKSHRRRGELLADATQRRAALSRAQQLAGWLRQQARFHALAAEGLLEEARVHLAAGNSTAASAGLQRFRGELPWRESAAAPEALLLLGTLLESTGNPEQAESVLGEARRRFEGALRQGGEAARSLAAEIGIAQARVLRALGRSGEARQLLVGLLEVPSGPRERAAAAIELGRIETESAVASRKRGDAAGRADAARGLRAALRALEALRPNGGALELEVDSLLELGRARAALAVLEPPAAGAGAGAAAAAAFEELVRRLSSDDERAIEARWSLAVLEARRGRLRAAAAALEGALLSSLRPETDAELVLRLGASLLAQGEAAEAARLFQEAAAAGEAFRPRAALGEALAREQLDGLAAAAPFFESAAAAGGRHGGRAAERLGAYHLAQGRCSEAEGIFLAAAEVLEDAEEKAAACHGAARAAASGGDRSRAAEILHRIIIEWPLTGAGQAASKLARGEAELAALEPRSYALAILEEPWPRREPPPAQPSLPGAPGGVLDDIRALRLEPAPFAAVELPDPLEPLTWMVLHPEPDEPPVEPPRDPATFLEDEKR
jgi:TolA-binding protein/tetratricopeptide (TPR) repeat protein